LFTYDPLFKTLDRDGKQLMDLIRGAGLSSGTVAKFRRNEIVKIDIIARVCRYLDVPITDVVEIIYE
jgi:DNA-binding Xre family transcriptional regulator